MNNVQEKCLPICYSSQVKNAPLVKKKTFAYVGLTDLQAEQLLATHRLLKRTKEITIHV